jgi:hypothetical protein
MRSQHITATFSAYAKKVTVSVLCWSIELTKDRRLRRRFIAGWDSSAAAIEATSRKRVGSWPKRSTLLSKNKGDATLKKKRTARRRRIDGTACLAAPE